MFHDPVFFQVCREAGLLCVVRMRFFDEATYDPATCLQDAQGWPLRFSTLEAARLHLQTHHPTVTIHPADRLAPSASTELRASRLATS